MDMIHILHLAQMPDQTETVEVQEYLPNLETLTPVQGRLTVSYRDSYLDVLGTVETIVTLTCDRCLQNYNYRLSIDASELIWLDATAEELYPPEREVSLDELVETLPPDGYFDPGQWLYDHLCLAVPHRKLCDQDCSGIAVKHDSGATLGDRRWASLESLKNQLPR
jgi:uncharacterized protein